MQFKVQTLLFEVTRSCNLNCRHCYATFFEKNKNSLSQDLSFAQIKQLFNKMRPLCIRNLNLSGGEPFLRKDLFKIIDYAGTCGFDSIAINTNGILLTNKAIINQIQDRSNLITMIFVSLDGTNEKSHDFIRGKGQFNKIIPIMKKFSSYQIPLGINITIGKWNFHEFPNFFDYYDKFNATYINFGVFLPFGAGKQIKNQMLSPKEYTKLIKLTNEQKELGYNVDLCSLPYSRLINEEISGYCCDIFTDFITITAQGEVIPCIMHEYSCGSLIEHGNDIYNITKHPLVEIFRDSSKLRKKMKGKCSNCSKFNICKGGCKLMTLLLKNDIFESDPLCPLELLEDDF